MIESDETVEVTLTAGTDYQLGATISGSVTISSDDVNSVVFPYDVGNPGGPISVTGNNNTFTIDLDITPDLAPEASVEWLVNAVGSAPYTQILFGTPAGNGETSLTFPGNGVYAVTATIDDGIAGTDNPVVSFTITVSVDDPMNISGSVLDQAQPATGTPAILQWNPSGNIIFNISQQSVDGSGEFSFNGLLSGASRYSVIIEGN